MPRPVAEADRAVEALGPQIDRIVVGLYADFDFRIDTTEWEVSFSRELQNGATLTTVEDIKISRGEENIFIWCFFLAIAELAIEEAEAYQWVKFIYIDDPISSLDEHNAIAVANHLAQLLKRDDNKLKTAISTHHSLFFTRDWDRNFDAIFGEDPHVPDPASIYVCRPSATLGS